MVSISVFVCLFICVAFGAQQLILNQLWNDDFASSPQSLAGINGWSIQGDIVGINTTNIYHGFFNIDNINLFRKFVLNVEGTCDISFHIVWGCQPSMNDSIKFSVENDVNINNYSTIIYYSNESPYQYLEDLRIYWGNNDIETSPQCIATDIDDMYTRGGYEIFYNYSYIVNELNKGIPFSINYVSSIENATLMTSYFGVYNVSIFCHTRGDILYSRTLFLTINIFTRHLVLWIVSGLCALILFCFFCVTMIQQKCNISNNKNINDSKAGKLITFKAKPQGAQSIIYEPKSAADVFRNLKKIKPVNALTNAVAGQTNIIIHSDRDDDDQKTDTISSNNSSNKKLSKGKDEYKPVVDQSGTNTPETTVTKINNNDIIMPVIKDDSDDSTKHIKLPTTIVKSDIDDTITINDSFRD